jgi:hypothetical protein
VQKNNLFFELDQTIIIVRRFHSTNYCLKRSAAAVVTIEYNNIALVSFRLFCVREFKCPVSYVVKNNSI